MSEWCVCLVCVCLVCVWCVCLVCVFGVCVWCVCVCVTNILFLLIFAACFLFFLSALFNLCCCSVNFPSNSLSNSSSSSSSVFGFLSSSPSPSPSPSSSSCHTTPSIQTTFIYS